jgi:hypothetical protein
MYVCMYVCMYVFKYVCMYVCNLYECNLFTYTKLIFAGANPTIARHNASVVNFYRATGSLAGFEKKNIFFYFEKRSILLQPWRCSY